MTAFWQTLKVVCSFKKKGKKLALFYDWFRKGLNPKGSPIGEARKTLEQERVAEGANALWILACAAKACVFWIFAVAR